MEDKPMKPFSAKKLFELDYIEKNPALLELTEMEKEKLLLEAYKELPSVSKKDFEERHKQLLDDYKIKVEAYKEKHKDNPDLISKISPIKSQSSPRKSSRKSSTKKSVDMKSKSKEKEETKSNNKSNFPDPWPILFYIIAFKYVINHIKVL